jgi:hypothetical protein
MTHFVFVDFENVPDLDLSALTGHSVKVTLVLGSKSKLKADLVLQIASLPFEVRLIKVGVTRKNALDFVLTFHLGETMARHPSGRFYIVSKDKNDFEPVVTHLRGNHHEVSRHDDIGSLPFVQCDGQLKTPPPSQPPVALRKSAVNPRAKVIARLKDSTRLNRPSTRKKLLAYIKADLGKGATDDDAESVVRELSDSHALTIDSNNRIEYAGPALTTPLV